MKLWRRMLQADRCVRGRCRNVPAPGFKTCDACKARAREYQRVYERVKTKGRGAA